MNIEHIRRIHRLPGLSTFDHDVPHTIYEAQSRKFEERTPAGKLRRVRGPRLRRISEGALLTPRHRAPLAPVDAPIVQQIDPAPSHEDAVRWARRILRQLESPDGS